MEKEYGKLTADQFVEFVRFMPGVLAMLRKVIERIARVPIAKFNSVMSGDYFGYGYAYELPYVQHLALVITALNRNDEVREMAAATDPQESVLEMLRKGIKGVDDKSQHESFEDAKVVALIYSLGRSIQSMTTYGRSISSLLQDVRDTGSHDSLFKAIRMDRAVVGCPTAMRHIAKAQLRDNADFFKSLRSALTGPNKKQLAGLDLMRYAMIVLREMELKHISEAELEKLMVEKLGVYPKHQPNARRNIRAHYQWVMKLPTI